MRVVDRYTAVMSAIDKLLCLDALARLSRPEGERCVGFSPIEEDTKLPRAVVRRCLRFWARKGYAEFHKGLIRESDGSFAGAGYCVTAFGLGEARKHLLSCDGGGGGVE